MMLQQNKKKQTKAAELVDDTIDEKNPFKNVVTEDIWIEDELFDKKDPEPIVDASKKIIDETKTDPFIDYTITDPQLTDSNDESDEND